jgi:hypothetical protein
MKRVQELRTISTLGEENQLLREDLARSRQLWREVTATLTEALEAISWFEKALVNYNSRKTAAERDWLAVWGIYVESVNVGGTNWI